MSQRFVVLFLLLLAACQPTAPQSVLPQSAWGPVLTFAQAEQTAAPALYVTESRVTGAWVGADEQNVFQALRNLDADRMAGVVRLPLGVRPSNQQFAPAANQHIHLFWLDSNVEGETRLFTALLKPDLERERDLTILTRQLTRRYSLLPAADGGVWAIASGGLASEPALVAHYVDGDGRWRLSDNYQIAANADWPAALLRADGLLSVYWLRTTDGMVMQSLFAEGVLLNPEPLIDGVTLGSGDRLESFTAAQDSTHIYLFWNITRADGRRESWLTANVPDAASWERPQRLSITLPTDASTPFDSGFNVGTVLAANAGTDAVGWVAPAAGVFPVLPVAAQAGGNISIVFMRGGQVVGYQSLGIAANLIGTPALSVDRDLYPYLSWSQPDPAGYANLYLASPKFATWAWANAPVK